MKPLPALIRLFRDEHGVGSVLMIILLPMFIGLAALAIDGASAYRMQTILQSTADAAAHAAAIDLPNTTTAKATAITYAQKNLPVAANGNVLVSSDIVTGNWASTTRTFTANGTPANAIQVIVRRAAANGNALPTAFLGIIGRSSWDVSAMAIAAQGRNPTPICMLALGTTGDSFTAKGAPKVDFSGCLIMSDSSISCNANPPQLGATSETAAVGTADSSCSTKNYSGVPAVPDPYLTKYPRTNIPSGPCNEGDTTYKAEPNNWNGKNPNWTQWTGAKSLSGSWQVCGDLQLSGDVTVSAPSSGAVLVIKNGQLDLRGHQLKTTKGSALTIIFTGTNSGAGSGNLHYPNDTQSGGLLDFNAPASGTWSGVALYQDPNLTNNLGLIYTGNSPAWKISGLVYMPNAALTFKGVVGQASNGQDCFVTVAKTVTVNGTGSIYAQTPDGSGCQLAGLQQPSASIPTGWQIVM